jgi:putative membrane protein
VAMGVKLRVFDLANDAYLWIKALHIISVISWMAGLLYLPRLFVYHCEARNGSELSEKLKVMELRLLKLIMRPARIASLIFGGLLLLNLDNDQWYSVWLLVKLACVVVLYGVHDMMNKWRMQFYMDVNLRTQKFYRVINEVPTIFMVLIVFVVVLKPV